MRLVFGIWLLVILAGITNAQEQPVILTLDESLAIALRDNKDILLNTEKLAQLKSGIGEARSGFLPQVNINSYATRSRGLYRKDVNNYSFQAGIKQYIYQGGKAANTLKQARYEAQAQGQELARVTDEIILEVKKAFYTLLIAKEFARINDQILDNSGKHLRSALLRYEKGEISESEVLKAKYLLAQGRQLHESSLNQLESAGILLKNILCIEEKTDVDIEGDFSYTPKEAAVDEAILKALSLRPEIKQYEAKVQADSAGVEISKAAGRPSIYGSFDYYSRSTTSLTFSPSKGWQDYNVIGFTLSWPVFDGWAAKYKVEQAISGLKQTRILQDKLKADVAAEVRDAYLSLGTALGALEAGKKDIELYADNLKVIQEKYKGGISSDLDLEDARLAFFISEFNRRQGVYDYLIARSKLDKAIGEK
ncbi:TolC family protein [bacterium]|nr:MAG: TolC family protein [bacterium]